MTYRLIVGVSIVLCLVGSGPSFAQEKAQEIDSALDMIEITEKKEELPLIGNGLHPEQEMMLNAEIIYDQGVQVINIKEPGADAHQVHIKEIVDILDVKNSSLNDVLDVISDKTGIIFITPEALPYSVSIFVENIDVWDLLKILLQQHEFAYYRTNGAVHIMSANVFRQRYGYDFPLPFPTKIVHVKYANFEKLIPLLNVEKSEEGSVWFDMKNQKIMMIDSYENLQKLQEMIRQRDVPLKTKEFVLENVFYGQIEKELKSLLTKEVGEVEILDEKGTRLMIRDAEKQFMLIEQFLSENDRKTEVPFRVKIVRINLNEEHMQGVDWEAIVSKYQTYGLKAVNGENASMTEQISLGTVTKEDYDVLIEALDTVGELAQLLVFDIKPVLNQAKTIDLETNDPFWSLRPGIKEIQEGPVVLDPNGFEMKVNLVIGEEAGDFAVKMLPRLHWMESNGINPIFIGSEDAEIKLGEDEVIVIGGLIRTEEIANTRKVPLLGDIPMVGSVFRRERTRFENTEYIIFLDLNIISDSQK